MTKSEFGRDIRDLYNQKEQEKKLLEDDIVKLKRKITQSQLVLREINSSTSPRFEKKQAKTFISISLKKLTRELEKLQSQLDAFDTTWLDGQIDNTRAKQ